MPLNLPNLDDVTWEGLTEEARSLIVSWAPGWTNHNPSDPGITLIELFAYLSEMLIYQLNGIPDANVREFLKLLNGPGSERKHEGNLHDNKLKTVQEMRRIQRAVTARDFEHLAADHSIPLPSGEIERVVRTRCIPRRNLESQDPGAQAADMPAHVSVVVVTDSRSHPSRELLRKVRDALEPARLLTTQIHVVPPRYLTFGIRITLTPYLGTVPETVKREAIKALEIFFDPLKGGSGKAGLPLGRSVYLSEIYQLLDDLPGVDYVRQSRHPKTGDRIEELVVAPPEMARLKRNKAGELEAIELNPDELVSVRINHDDVVIAPV